MTVANPLLCSAIPCYPSFALLGASCASCRSMNMCCMSVSHTPCSLFRATPQYAKGAP